MSDLLGGKLDNLEIKKEIGKSSFSTGYKPSSQLINDTLEQLWFHDFYNSFISDEVYLSYLLSYLNQIKPRKFDRYEFYKYFFDQIEKKLSARKILQQIALTFEKLQSDAIPPEEYNSLLQQVNAPTDTFNASWMDICHLGKVKKRDEKELFIWEHHTLTEFLVAEYLLEGEDVLGEFQKLAILKQEGITAFKPSWSGVLRFLIESKKGLEVSAWLISFLEKHPDDLDDNLAELLVYELANQTSKIKKRVFNLVYNSYFEKVTWIPVWARVRLSKFVDKQSYKRLKTDIKVWANKTETFVRRGNVVSIIEGILKDKNKIVDATEKKFWLTKLIEFANNPNDDGNGVLQRQSLGALGQFKDEDLISQVSQKCYEETRDSLVRNEFIQFCIDTNPNSPKAIDYFIKDISSIYARHGLYRVTKQEAIEYLLSKISQDPNFLREFLDKESIFDKDGSDRELLKNIKRQINNKVIQSLKRTIFTVLRITDYYHEGQSSFLRQVIQIINEHEPRYLFEILTDIKNEKDDQKIDRLFWDSRDLLALLLTKDNVKEYFDFLKDFPERTTRDKQYVVYSAKRLNGEVGNLAYQEAVRLKLVEKVDESHSEKYFKEQEMQRKQQVYKSFLHQLEPEPGKFQTGIFEYFIKNKEEIQKQWKKKDKQKLLKLAVEICLQKINPREFRVTLANKSEGNSQFTWSAPASYYGDLLDVIKELAPEEIKKHRQNIIDFIPYEFDTSATLDFVEQLSDADFTWVNQVMSDKNDHRRYLIPQTYIYLVGEYAKRHCKLSNAKSILKSFVTDPDIRDYTQRSALENLVYFIDESDKETKKFLKDIFSNSSDQELVEIANGLLITVYKDEKAINWRFEKLKKPLEFNREDVEGKAHSVGAVEEELMRMSSAKPLMDLRDEKYLPKFLDLLDYSFQFTREKDNKKYWEYVNYLWKTVSEFVDRLKEKGSFIPLMELESWVEEHSQYENINWFEARIKEIKRNYLNLVHPFDKLIDGVEELNKIGVPAASIAYFLFKAQLVESRLRDLILGINYFLEKANKKLPIYRRLNHENKKRLKNSTLSQLCDELNCYQSQLVEKLKNKLSQFSTERNKFNHELYNQNKDIRDLSEEAKKYTKFAEESLDLIHSVWEEILTIR